MSDNTFTRLDLSEFDGIDDDEWYEDVDQYDEEGELETPMPNGDVYEAIEYGRLVAHVYMRPAATIIVNAPRFLAALRAAYAEIDRLRASALTWVTVTEDINTLPYEQGLVVVVPFDGRPTFLTTRNRNIFPGDRWIPIREVPA